MFRVIITTVILALLILVPSVALASHGDAVTERVWGSGEEWEMIFQHPIFDLPANEKAQRPFYIIAAIDADNPQSPGHDPIIGDHDHVVSVPPGNRGSFSAVWRVWAVLPGPNADPGVNVALRNVSPPDPSLPLLYSADVDGDGNLEELTSAALVEAAIAQGLAVLADTEIVLAGPIRQTK